MKLSICIATYNRGAFIGETMDSILGQMEPGVEIVVVDGASTDNTPEIMAEYIRQYEAIRYFREPTNSGVDADFDRAVGYAGGEYCWLMSDDDLLKPGAIATVLSVLESGEDLVVVNSEVRNPDMSGILKERLLEFDADRFYRPTDREAFLGEVGSYLSFIGCVVIRREVWLARERAGYYGTLFIHMGVIFQQPALAHVRVIARPLIAIRYGNAMWTQRSFEIWMFKWPRLVWSFGGFSDAAKSRVCPREPFRGAKTLFLHRALGSYSAAEFGKHLAALHLGVMRKAGAYLISIFPASLANAAVLLYLSARGSRPADRMSVYDLLHSRNAGAASRCLVRRLRLDQR